MGWARRSSLLFGGGEHCGCNNKAPQIVCDIILRQGSCVLCLGFRSPSHSGSLELLVWDGPPLVGHPVPEVDNHVQLPSLTESFAAIWVNAFCFGEIHLMSRPVDPSTPIPFRPQCLQGPCTHAVLDLCDRSCTVPSKPVQMFVNISISPF